MVLKSLLFAFLTYMLKEGASRKQIRVKGLKDAVYNEAGSLLTA